MANGDSKLAESGGLDRREALRRVGLGGVGLIGGAVALTGCDPKAPKPSPTTDAVTEDAPDVPTTESDKTAKTAAPAEGSPRWAMVIDLRRCIGCRGCTVACKAEFDVPLGDFSCVVRQEELGKYPDSRKAFLPTLCNHCSGGKKENPPCVEECPNNAMERARYKAPDGTVVRYRIGATYKRPDGAVLLATKYCTGCEKCIEACPYGVRWSHPGVAAPLDKSKQAVGKCSFCTHRVEKGVLPACVNVCQGKARIFGDLNDPASPVSKLAEEFDLLAKRDSTTLLPGDGTDPHVFYIDPDGDIEAVYQKGREYKDEVF
jgi:tetrathionate reductase subunit B